MGKTSEILFSAAGNRTHSLVTSVRAHIDFGRRTAGRSVWSFFGLASSSAARNFGVFFTISVRRLASGSDRGGATTESVRRGASASSAGWHRYRCLGRTWHRYRNIDRRSEIHGIAHFHRCHLEGRGGVGGLAVEQSGQQRTQACDCGCASHIQSVTS